MIFDSPLEIFQQPEFETYLVEYPNQKFASIVYEAHTKIYWRTVIAYRQDYKCYWCGCEMTPERKRANSATIEHMIPRSEGGLDDPSNYTVACNSCNNKRGSIPADEFRKLLTEKANFAEVHANREKNGIRKKIAEINESETASFKLAGLLSAETLQKLMHLGLDSSPKSAIIGETEGLANAQQGTDSPAFGD